VDDTLLGTNCSLPFYRTRWFLVAGNGSNHVFEEGNIKINELWQVVFEKGEFEHESGGWMWLLLLWLWSVWGSNIGCTGSNV
jgi:hypothetical protein